MPLTTQLVIIAAAILASPAPHAVTDPPTLAEILRAVPDKELVEFSLLSNKALARQSPLRYRREEDQFAPANLELWLDEHAEAVGKIHEFAGALAPGAKIDPDENMTLAVGVLLADATRHAVRRTPESADAAASSLAAALRLATAEGLAGDVLPWVAALPENGQLERTSSARRAALIAALAPLETDRPEAARLIKLIRETPSATPNLDELESIAKDIDGMHSAMASMTDHTAPGLVIPHPPKDVSQEDLARWLESSQPLIERMIVLADKPLERARGVGAERHSGAALEARVNAVVGVLLADSGRCIDKGGAEGVSAAVKRLAASISLADQMTRRENWSTRVQGATLVGLASKRVSALAKQKPELWTSMPTPAAREISAAFVVLDTEDPAHLIGDWETAARQRLKWCRNQFGGGDDAGPRRYAAYIGEVGVDEHLHNNIVMMKDLPLPVRAPFRQFAPEALKLSTEQLSAALDAVDEAIGPVAEALSREDRKAVSTALEFLAADRTRLSALVLSGTAGLIPTTEQLRAPIVEASKALETLPK